MSNSVMLAMLLAVGALAPGEALGQGAMELAVAGPQPHFVAAWAPKKEREAERSAALAGRVSLELRDVPLDAALKALTNQAGLRITYSRAMLPAGKRVTISATDIAVVTAMTEMLFRSGLDVVVDRDGALALVVCRHLAGKAETQDSGTIVGRVTDKTSESPLYGATISVEGSRVHTTTDAEGRYTMRNVPSGTHAVRARYIGYTALAVSVVVRPGEEVTADFELEKSVQKLDELVTVTPGGMQAQVKALASPITVITASDIEVQRPQTINDVIRQAVPGALGFAFPNSPSSTTLSVRGATQISSGGAAKIFIDGIEVAGHASSPIDPTSIERVEVIRGPQGAAVYGPDAAAGVVQIFTKRGDPSLTRPEVILRAETGVLQTPYDEHKEVLRTDVAAEVHGRAGAATYALGASWWRLPDWTGGGSPSSQSVPSAFGALRVAHDIVNVDLTGRYFGFNNGVDVNPLLLQAGFLPLSKPLFQRQQGSNQTLGARLRITPAGWWQNQLTLGLDRQGYDQLQTRARRTTPDDTLLSLSTFSLSKLSAAYNASFAWAPSASVAVNTVVGVDYYRSPTHLEATGAALNTEGTIRIAPGGTFSVSRSVVTNTGYFAQIEAGLQERLFFTAGVRADDNSTLGADVGAVFSPRVGLAYNHGFGETTLKGRVAYGRAIRAPDPAQAFGGTAFGTITLENPLLRAIRQEGWDAGVDILFGSHGSLGVTAYDQTAKDLILLVQVAQAPVPTFQNQNVGRVTNRGVEIEATVGLFQERLRARMQYAYTFSRIDDLGPHFQGDEQVGDRPTGIPSHTAGAALTFMPWNRTTITGGATYVGAFRQTDVLSLFRCFGGTGPCRESSRDYIVHLPGFVKLNLAVTQQLLPYLFGSLAVDNFTNNLAYEGLTVVPVQGRLTSIGLQFRY